MPIVPDDKDWTWVLERPCPECGFDASALQSPRAGAACGRLGAAEGCRDGASFSIAGFGRYFVHDPVHHLYDVTGRRGD